MARSAKRKSNGRAVQAKCAPTEHARRGPRANAEEILERVAPMFEACGTAARLQLVLLLLEDARSVAALARATGRNPSLVSQQLAVLRQARVVRGYREGRTVRYAIFDDHTRTLIHAALAHASHPESRPIES